MWRISVAIVLGLVVSYPVFGQTPRPFPRLGEPQAPKPSSPSQPAPAAPATPAPQTLPTTPQPPQDPAAPTPAALVFPAYPSSQFLASLDAGRGQRYVIFGTTAPFADVVTYYRTQLDERGNLVFKEPPTHMFEVGRFRDETMAFPPGVTVKDWTWGGSQGYPNPKLHGQPVRFPTIIVIVPPPPQASER